jgi:hypothetical protein
MSGVSATPSGTPGERSSLAEKKRVMEDFARRFIRLLGGASRLWTGHAAGVPGRRALQGP